MTMIYEVKLNPFYLTVEELCQIVRYKNLKSNFSKKNVRKPQPTIHGFIQRKTTNVMEPIHKIRKRNTPTKTTRNKKNASQINIHRIHKTNTQKSI